MLYSSHISWPTHLHFRRVHAYKARHFQFFAVVDVEQHVPFRDGPLVRRSAPHTTGQRSGPPMQCVLQLTKQGGCRAPLYETSFEHRYKYFHLHRVLMQCNPQQYTHLIQAHVRELAEFSFFQLERQSEGWRVWVALDEHLQE